MQSGKSALIEHIKNYANPDYTINQTLLGDGTFPKTERTHTSCATSNLPSYKVYKSGTMVKLKCLSKGPDNEDGDLLLSCDDSVEFKLSRSNLNDMPFCFLDTPGLCNYDDKDSSHATGIIEGILSVQSFNLILIAINLQNPLTAELLLALQYYSKVLDGLHNNIAFVFTHAHYDNYCLTDLRQSMLLAKKVQTLSRISQGSAAGNLESYPIFTIDLTDKMNPIAWCMTHNTLRDISWL